MGYEEVMKFVFQTTESAHAAMDAIDEFESWETARQYGSGGYYLTITSAARDLQRILEVIAKYGGKRC
jgi:hypothetical protein